MSQFVTLESGKVVLAASPGWLTPAPSSIVGPGPGTLDVPRIAGHEAKTLVGVVQRADQRIRPESPGEDFYVQGRRRGSPRIYREGGKSLAALRQRLLALGEESGLQPGATEDVSVPSYKRVRTSIGPPGNEPTLLPVGTVKQIPDMAVRDKLDEMRRARARALGIHIGDVEFSAEELAEFGGPVNPLSKRQLRLLQTSANKAIRTSNPAEKGVRIKGSPLRKKGPLGEGTGQGDADPHPHDKLLDDIIAGNYRAVPDEDANFAVADENDAQFEGIAQVITQGVAGLPVELHDDFIDMVIHAVVMGHSPEDAAAAAQEELGSGQFSVGAGEASPSNVNHFSPGGGRRGRGSGDGILFSPTDPERSIGERQTLLQMRSPDPLGTIQSTQVGATRARVMPGGLPSIPAPKTPKAPRPQKVIPPDSTKGLIQALGAIIGRGRPIFRPLPKVRSSPFPVAEPTPEVSAKALKADAGPIPAAPMPTDLAEWQTAVAETQKIPKTLQNDLRTLAGLPTTARLPVSDPTGLPAAARPTTARLPVSDPNATRADPADPDVTMIDPQPAASAKSALADAETLAGAGRSARGKQPRFVTEDFPAGKSLVGAGIGGVAGGALGSLLGPAGTLMGSGYGAALGGIAGMQAKELWGNMKAMANHPKVQEVKTGLQGYWQRHGWPGIGKWLGGGVGAIGGGTAGSMLGPIGTLGGAVAGGLAGAHIGAGSGRLAKAFAGLFPNTVRPGVAKVESALKGGVAPPPLPGTSRPGYAQRGIRVGAQPARAPLPQAAIPVGASTLPAAILPAVAGMFPPAQPIQAAPQTPEEKAAALARALGGGRVSAAEVAIPRIVMLDNGLRFVV